MMNQQEVSSQFPAFNPAMLVERKPQEMLKMFNYYKVEFKLTAPMLGTATQTSIYYQHVITKAQKEIEKANKLGDKITKALAKFKGTEPIAPEKELAEMQAVLRTFCALVGKPLEVPNDITAILEMSKVLEEEFREKIKTLDTVDATVFLRGADGLPIISTHMILGNIKSNVKTVTASGGGQLSDLLKSKTAVAETLALDIKFVEDFMKTSEDIVRCVNGKVKYNGIVQTIDTEGDLQEQLPAPRGRHILDKAGRVLLERPLVKWDGTTIACSEQLSPGVTFGCTIRVREGSVFDNETVLRQLFELGKSQGFGAWRGSGTMGSYKYKLEALPDFMEETDADGFM